MTDTPRPASLSVGPYGRIEWVAAERRWRRTLTDEGRKLCEAYYAKYPSVNCVGRVVGVKIWVAAQNCIDDDELQSIYLRSVTEAFTRFDPARGKIVTILIWVLRTQITRVLKQLKRRPAHESLAVCPEYCEPPAPPEPDADVREYVTKALEALAPRARRALLLHYAIDGPAFTGAEVAKILGCTRQNVNLYLHRGLTAMRDVLEPGRVPDALRRVLDNGPHTVRRLAKRLGVSAIDVRTHLNNLCEAGEAVREVRDGTVVWSLNRTGPNKKAKEP